jgi:hypothetical protein
MKTSEVASALQVSEEEILRLAKERVLKPLRGYRRPLRFSGTQIEKWLNGENV